MSGHATTTLSVPGGLIVDMGVAIADFLRLAEALPGVESRDADHWTSFTVHGRTFGYLWPRTETVGLKQTLAEQAALVAERPDVFEVQFTTAGFGWVVVQLQGIDLDELAELVFEAWRLTAPPSLATEDLGPHQLSRRAMPGDA